MHSQPSNLDESSGAPVRDDLFEALAESAPDAIVTIDGQSRILFANSAVCRIFGYDAGELIGEPLSRIIPERLRAAHAAGIKRYLSEGTRKISWTGIPLPALRKDGTEVPCEISFGELVASDGGRMFSGFIRDVSDRVRHQAELETARAAAEDALRELRAIHAITDSALAQGDYESMLRELLRRLREELGVDSSAVLLLDDAGEHLVVRATEGIAQAGLEGQVVPLGSGISGRVAATGEALIVNDVSSVANVHAAFASAVTSIAAVPIRAHAGVIGVVLIGAREVREFGQREQRLLEVVADRMSGVLARTRLFETQRSAHAELKRLNDELSARAGEERALRTVAQRIAGAIRVPEVMHEIAEGALAISGSLGAYVEQVVSANGEVEVVAASGEQTPPVGTRVAYPGSLTEEIITNREPVFLVKMEGVGAGMAPYLSRHCPECSVLVLPLFNEEKCLGALVLVRAAGENQFEYGVVNRARTLGDLASLALQRLIALAESERRRTEAEAAVKTRDEVLSIVSHDLRNPVSTVAMSAQLLKDPTMKLTEAQRGQQLDVVLRSAHRMNRLITDLLDVARIEGRRFTISCRCEEPSSLAAEVCESFRPIFETKSLMLDCDRGVSIPKILVDRDRVLQVLSNYLNNAAKFTSAGGTIGLRVSVVGEEVRFAVTDSGPGIPAGDIDQVFSRFWQAKRTSHLGAGLGLAIAKGIADAHKGRVWVESVVGQGSTFGFAVPAAKECAGQASAERSQ